MLMLAKNVPKREKYILAAAISSKKVQKLKKWLLTDINAKATN